MRVLVISPCSKEQTPDIPNKLQPIDFSSCDYLAQRIEELNDYKTPAAKMYVGREHREMMRGLRKIRRCYGREVVDLSIVSTGYGLVSECCTIVPYDVPLCKSPVLLEKERSDKLHNDIENLIRSGNYDLVFFLLSKEYYEALKLHCCPFQIPNGVTLVFLIGKNSSDLIPCLKRHYPVCVFDELPEFGGSNRDRKGRVFRELCKIACCEGIGIFENIKRDPQQIIKIMHRVVKRC